MNKNTAKIISSVKNMAKLKLIFMTITLLIASSTYSYGQGCSDAGFCTINSLKPHSMDSAIVLSHQFTVGAFWGQADNAISVYGTYLEYSSKLSSKFGLNVKLTTLAQNGNTISVFGLSDIFVNANYKVSERLELTLGAKIPLSTANRTKDNLALPMDYQSSLGTFDVIFGIGYGIENFQFVAAIQQPLTQNDNQFIATKYPLDSELRTFQSTNRFERSGDILLRVSYPVSINSKLTVIPSILPIYHLANDKYTDEFHVRKEINGSKGLTLNGNVYLDYAVDRKTLFKSIVGIPFIVRDSRPDGLTRSLIVNIEYRIRF